MEDNEETHKPTYSGSKIPKLLLIYAGSRSEHRRCHSTLSSHDDGPSLSVCKSRKEKVDAVVEGEADSWKKV